MNYQPDLGVLKPAVASPSHGAATASAPPEHRHYAVYQIVTSSGTMVGFDRRQGCMCHYDVGAVEPGIEPVLGVTVHAAPNMIFLMGRTDPDLVLSLPESPWRGAVVGLRMGQTDRPGHVVLAHVLTGLRVSAEPITPPQTVGSLPINRPEVGEWEVFRLMPEAEIFSTKEHTFLMESLTRLAEVARHGGEALGNQLRDTDGISGSAWAAVVSSLPQGDLDALARVIGSSPELAGRLARLLPGDLWASQAIPKLARFLASQRTTTLVRDHIGPEYDFVSTCGRDGAYWTTAHLLNAMARRSVLPRRGVCVLATCRNEGLYLPEWIAYHQAVGVEKFVIFSNDNDDGSDELLEALCRNHVVTWLSNAFHNVSPQYKAYGYALQFLPEILDYEWTFVLDVDEFFVFNTGMFSSIGDYVGWANTQPTDAIGLSWVVYGPAPEPGYTDVPVHRRLLTRNVTIDPHVKTLFRSRLFGQSHPHFPIWDDYVTPQYRCSDLRPHPRERAGLASAYSPHPRADFAWVNHYISKSAEEFLIRRSMQRADLRQGDAGPFDVFTSAHADWFRNLSSTHDKVRDDRAIQCTPGFDARLAALRDLPGVDAACRSIRLRFEARRKEARAAMLANPRFSVAGSADAWFRSQVLGQGAV